MENLIGQGRTADVYQYDDKVVKVFHHEFTNLANEEFEKGKKINNLGLSAPHVYELIDIDSKKGIIYEFVHGINMIQVMQKQPLRVNQYAKQLAESHAKIHSKSIPGLMSVKDSLSSVINNVHILSQAEKALIIEYIDTLPDGNYICHYDFHPDNILVSNGTLRVIDWMTVEAGNPCADVCRTGIILNSSVLPPGISFIQQIIIKSFRRKFYKKYIAHYCNLTGVTPEEINKWLLPVAAARLAEEIQDEASYLNNIVSRKLSQLRS